MNKILIIAISCLLLVVSSVAGGYFYLEGEIKKPFKAGEEKIFEIKKGETGEEIAKNLEKEGLIKNDIYFLYDLFKGDKTGDLKDGYYCLSSSMNIPEIEDKLENGGLTNQIKITFPEGFRISQIEERIRINFQLITNNLQPTNNLQLSDFKIKDFKEDYEFLADAPDEANLEGYLFPDTYFFTCREPEVICKEGKPEILKCGEGDLNEIIGKFLSNFDKKLNSEFREEIKNQGENIFDIVKMASILEREVRTYEDRKIASGIFWRRLVVGQPLQSCATVAYVLGNTSWEFNEMRVDIAGGREIDSLYNTYKYKGLPAGPISNPGIESLKAAIYPQESDYNFFLNTSDGKTIFSKTLEEHNQNKIKYYR